MKNLYKTPSGTDFIFIRIPKVAGASLGTAFKPYQVCEDLTEAYGTHATAKQLYTDDPTGYNKCISFTFVRNPWDRFVSWYSWQIQGTKSTKNVTFEEYIQHLLENKCIAQDYHTPKQLHYLVDSDNALISPANGSSQDLIEYNHFETYFDNPLLVQHILKYENLHQELDKICKIVDMPVPYLPHEHKSKRKPYQEYYTKQTEEIIYNFYKDDIERLKYKFGE